MDNSGGAIVDLAAALAAAAATAVALPRLRVSGTTHAVRLGTVLIVHTTSTRWCMANEWWCLSSTILTVRAQSRAVIISHTLVERRRRRRQRRPRRCCGCAAAAAVVVIDLVVVVAARGPLVILTAGSPVLDVRI